MTFYVPLLYIHQFCSEQLGLYTYQNYLEILVLSWSIYKTLIWLQKDRTKNLCLYAYAYSAILIGSHLLQAYVLFWILFILSPVFALLTIVLYQNTIQRYFVHENIEKFSSHAIAALNWPELLVRSVLLTAHHKKHVFCIIQRNDPIAHLLKIPYTLNTAIQPNITDMLLSSSMLDNPTLMVISQSGTIKYINASWSDRFNSYMLMHNEHNTLEHNKQAATLLAQMSDSFIWYIDPITQQATLWHQDTIFEDIAPQKLLTICQKLLHKERNQSLGEIHVQKNNADHTTSSHY